MKNEMKKAIVKCLMITGSSEDPRIKNDWWCAMNLEVGKNYSLEELIKIANCDGNDALWVYEGEEWEDNLNPEVPDLFHPWDRPECLKLMKPGTIESEEEDTFMEDWKKEIAMEEGMLQGINAYNDWME